MHTRTHVRTHLTALFPGLPRWADTRKVKPIWILLKQETVSGSGISWAIRKSAFRSRLITTPAPHHSSFLQAGCPSCRPSNSVKALKHYQGNKDKTCSVLYFCYRQKVTERRRTKQAAGDKQVVNRESECDPDSTSDMPATLHNQHSYNTTSNTPMILTCIITSLCTTYQKSNSLQKTPNTEQHNKVEK